MHIILGQKGRLPEREDSDQLTDLFAAVFGTNITECFWHTLQVLVMVHSIALYVNLVQYMYRVLLTHTTGVGNGTQ